MTLLDAAATASPSRAGTAAEVQPAAWPARVTLALAAALAAAMSSAFALWRIAGAVVPWDSKNQFYPTFRFVGDALRHGTVPSWNPYQFAGSPAIADPQSLLLTPSMAILAFLWPDASMPAFDAMVEAHLLFGGLAMLGLARRWSWHPASALLASLVFMLGGSAASRLQHTGMIVSYAFVPAAVWAMEAALDRRSAWLALVAGGAAALMALGRDQVAFLSCLALLGFIARHVAASRHPLAMLRRGWPLMLLAGLVTLAITIVPILLTMQFLHDSNRPGIAYGLALEGSLDPVNMLTFIAPNVFGSLDRPYGYWGPGAATVAGNDWTDRSIDYLFAGTVAAVLLVWHGLAGGRVLRRGSRFFSLLLAAAMFYAVGRWTPVFALAFDRLPGVSLYRRPADATFIANIALALLAGSLLQAYLDDGLPRFVGRRARLFALFAIVRSGWLVGSGFAFAKAAGHLVDLPRSLGLAACFVAGAVAILVAGRRRRHRGVAAFVLAGLTALQLVGTNAASPLNAEPAATYSAYDGFTPDQKRGLAVLDAELERRHATGEYPRVEILGIDGSWQNAAEMLHLESTLGYNPLRIAAYEQAVGVGESAVDPMLRSFPDTFRGYNSRLAGLLGLDYLVLDRPIAELPRHIPRPRATLLFAGTRFFIYRLDGAGAPRAAFATRLVAIDGERAIEDGLLPGFDGRCEALVEISDAARLRDGALLGRAGDGQACPVDGGSHAAITSYGDSRITVDVDADRPGVLVLHDLDYPGWEARVDGAEAPLLRADLLFRGVELTKGHHSVEFSFHPLSAGNLAAAVSSMIPDLSPGPRR